MSHQFSDNMGPQTRALAVCDLLSQHDQLRLVLAALMVGSGAIPVLPEGRQLWEHLVRLGFVRFSDEEDAVHLTERGRMAVTKQAERYVLGPVTLPS